MSRKAKVLYRNLFAGIISETDEGYLFCYEKEYLQTENAEPVSLTLPLKKEPYQSKTIFPFFDGLIPEGWLLSIAEDVWKLNPRDRMGLLLTCCKDCIGAVSIIPIKEGSDE
ncbi:MAG: HipA N-terminal domain-containing protein [Candidatus Cloacimonetes bacterium]|nr:HipA N-terminal domain-containing protein [Candidatus Cloacimonadota bacterium]